jgi:hypothetical protein
MREDCVIEDGFKIYTIRVNFFCFKNNAPRRYTKGAKSSSNFTTHSLRGHFLPLCTSLVHRLGRSCVNWPLSSELGMGRPIHAVVPFGVHKDRSCDFEPIRIMPVVHYLSADTLDVVALEA